MLLSGLLRFKYSKAVHRKPSCRAPFSFHSKRNISAVSFKINDDNARQKLMEDSHLFEETDAIYSKKSIRPHYVPFHGGEFPAIRTSYAAKYGINRTINDKTGDPIIDVTEWHSCGGTLDPYSHPRDHYHIYAGFEYPKKMIEEVFHSELERIPFSAYELSVPPAVTVDKLEIDQAFAQEKMKQCLQKMEEERVISFIKNKYRADKIELHTATVHLESAFTLHTFYLPVFIHQYEAFGMTMMKMINGRTGKVAGQRICSGRKITETFGLSTVMFSLLLLSPGNLLGALFFGPVVGVGIYFQEMIKRQCNNAKQQQEEHIDNTKKARDEYTIFKTNRLHQEWLNRQRQEEEQRREARPNQQQRQQRQQRQQQQQKYWRNTEEDSMKKNGSSKKQEFSDEELEYLSLFGLFYGQHPRHKHNNKNSSHRQSQFTNEEVELLGLLGLSSNDMITSIILKRAYHQQIKKWHPDNYRDDPNAANMMSIRLTQAYQKLNGRF